LLQKGVRPVAFEDLPRVVEVWEASVRATHHFVAEKDILFFRMLVQDGLPHIQHLACVRTTSGEVAGFVGVEGEKIEMLFIHPRWRGMGIGERLTRYAIDELFAAEVDVNEQNEQALGFYLHLGFEVVGRSKLDGTGRPYPILHMRLRDV
jgi:putative acetyltransferase